MLSDCMEVTDEGTDISCKSETSGTLVFPDFVKFVAMTGGPMDRFAEFAPFRVVSPDSPLAAPATPLRVYLFLCSFLK